MCFRFFFKLFSGISLIFIFLNYIAFSQDIGTNGFQAHIMTKNECPFVDRDGDGVVTTAEKGISTPIASFSDFQGKKFQVELSKVQKGFREGGCYVKTQRGSTQPPKSKNKDPLQDSQAQCCMLIGDKTGKCYQKGEKIEKKADDNIDMDDKCFLQPKKEKCKVDDFKCKLEERKREYCAQFPASVQCLPTSEASADEPGVMPNWLIQQINATPGARDMLCRMKLYCST